MDGLAGLIALLVILGILWPILKFVFRLTAWVIVLTMLAVAALWVLLVMGGCAAILMM